MIKIMDKVLGIFMLGLALLTLWAAVTPGYLYMVG
jgi:hypothetical protein